MKQDRVDLKTVHDMNDPDISECPYCGHDEYYIKMHYSGNGICRHRFDGESAENGDLYDCLNNTIVGKFAYCCNCDRRIFRIHE